MASSDPEIKDGLTLPVWMKTKPTREFEPFATSPPAPEDFYIRYPKTDALFGKTNQQQDFNQVFSDSSKQVTASVYNIVKEKDWSKHTKPCQDVLHGIAPINTSVNSVSSKPKAAGIDDGFKGDGAACGSSIVKVAQQMISSTRTPRGFTVASPDEDAAISDDFRRNHSARRGSKSLPASPHTSPTSRRKMNSNRYFTSPFEPIEDSAHNRSWLSIALLGYKKDLTTSTSTLCEEDALDTRLHGVHLAESVENLGPAPRGKEPQSILKDAPRQTRPTIATIRPRPSELREMNFWSPTSM